jgi:phage terminase small subunit
MWRCIVPLIEQVTDAGEIDSFQLAAMCDWWGLYRDKRTNGTDWRDANQARAAFDTFNRLASRFGLTPLDRQALHTQQAKPDDKEAKFFSVVG